MTLHRRLAYVPGEVNLWPNLTGGEVIDLLGTLRGGLDWARRSALLERFQLDPTKKCRAYSKGNRQKVALVAAFASDVELYLLDEPTSGLDPLMEFIFQDVVRELRSAGRTVLLSSHILARGRGTVRSRHHHPGRPSGRLGNVRRAAPPDPHDRRCRDRHTHRHAERPAGVHDVKVDGTRARFSADNGELNHILEHLIDYDVRTLTSSPPTLEELFIRHYGDDRATRSNALPVLVGAR